MEEEVAKSEILDEGSHDQGRYNHRGTEPSIGF